MPNVAPLLWQPQIHKCRNLRGRRRVEIREHRNYVARPRIDFQTAAHPWRATAVTHESTAVFARIRETVGILAASSRIDLASNQQFSVLNIQQLVIHEGGCEFQKVSDRRVPATGRSAAIG